MVALGFWQLGRAEERDALKRQMHRARAPAAARLPRMPIPPMRACCTARSRHNATRLSVATRVVVRSMTEPDGASRPVPHRPVARRSRLRTWALTFAPDDAADWAVGRSQVITLRSPRPRRVGAAGVQARQPEARCSSPTRRSPASRRAPSPIRPTCPTTTSPMRPVVLFRADRAGHLRAGSQAMAIGLTAVKPR